MNIQENMRDKGTKKMTREDALHRLEETRRLKREYHVNNLSLYMLISEQVVDNTSSSEKIYFNRQRSTTSMAK